MSKHRLRSAKRPLAMLLAMLVILTFLPAAALAAGDYSGHWAESSIDRAVEMGWFIDGNNTRPGASITRAEFVTMVNRMKGYTGSADLSGFSDIKESDWYYSAFSTAVALGYVQGSDGKLNPTANITRNEAVAIFTRISGLDTASDYTSALQNVRDAQGIPDWAKPYAGAAVKAGLIAGTDGNFNGGANITRAETAVLLERLYDNIRTYGFAGTYTGDAGGVVIASSGVTLKDCNITGDLTISPAVGDGEVWLNNVKVGGLFDVQGGGKNSVYLENCEIAAIIVTKDEVRVVFADGTVAAYANVGGQNSSIVIAEGAKVDSIVVEGGNADIVVETGAEVGSVAVEAAGTTLEVAGTVAEVTINADNTAISGTGKVETVAVESGSGTEIKTDGAKVTVSENAGSVTTGDGATINAGTIGDSKPDTQTTDTGGGGSGGGGSSSGGGGYNPGTPSEPSASDLAQTLADTLNAIAAGCASRSGTTVTVSSAVTLNANIEVPGGVTLVINYSTAPKTMLLSVTDTYALTLANGATVKIGDTTLTKSSGTVTLKKVSGKDNAAFVSASGTATVADIIDGTGQSVTFNLSGLTGSFDIISREIENLAFTSGTINATLPGITGNMGSDGDFGDGDFTYTIDSGAAIELDYVDTNEYLATISNFNATILYDKDGADNDVDLLRFTDNARVEISLDVDASGSKNKYLVIGLEVTAGTMDMTGFFELLAEAIAQDPSLAAEFLEDIAEDIAGIPIAFSGSAELIMDDNTDPIIGTGGLVELCTDGRVTVTVNADGSIDYALSGGVTLNGQWTIGSGDTLDVSDATLSLGTGAHLTIKGVLDVGEGVVDDATLIELLGDVSPGAELSFVGNACELRLGDAGDDLLDTYFGIGPNSEIEIAKGESKVTYTLKKYDSENGQNAAITLKQSWNIGGNDLTVDTYTTLTVNNPVVLTVGGTFTKTGTITGDGDWTGKAGGGDAVLRIITGSLSNEAIDGDVIIEVGYEPIDLTDVTVNGEITIIPAASPGAQMRTYGAFSAPAGGSVNLLGSSQATGIIVAAPVAVTTAPSTDASSITVNNSGASLGLAGNTSSVSIPQNVELSSLTLLGDKNLTIQGQGKVSNVVIGGDKTPNVTISEDMSVDDLLVTDAAAPTITVNGIIKTVVSVTNAENGTRVSGNGTVNNIKSSDNDKTTVDDTVTQTNEKETVTQQEAVVVFGDSDVSKTYGDMGFSKTVVSNSGNGTIAYTTSDTSVCHVNVFTGAVTIVGAGTATITATSSPTAEYSAGTASYTVTVAKKALTVTGITAVYTAAYTAGAGAVSLDGTAVLSGLVQGDDVTLTGTSSASFTETSTEAVVTVTGYSIEGAKAGNYEFSQPTVNTVDTTVLKSKTPIEITGVSVTSATAVKVMMDDLGLAAENFTITGGDGAKNVTKIAYSGGAYTLTVASLSAYEIYTLTVSNGEGYIVEEREITWVSASNIKTVNGLKNALATSGTSFTVSAEITIPAGETIVIPAGKTVSFSKSPTLNGDIEILGTMKPSSSALSGATGNGNFILCQGGLIQVTVLISTTKIEGIEGRVNIPFNLLEKTGAKAITGNGKIKLTVPAELSTSTDYSLTICSGIQVEINTGSKAFVVKGSLTVEENAKLVVSSTHSSEGFRFGWESDGSRFVLKVDGTLEVDSVAKFNEYAVIEIGQQGTLILNKKLNMTNRPELYPNYQSEIRIADGGKIINNSTIDCAGIITGNAGSVTGSGSISGTGTWPGKETQ